MQAGDEASCSSDPRGRRGDRLPRRRTGRVRRARVHNRRLHGADRELIEQLVWTEAVFHKGTPGSAAQFRSREEAYKLWEKLFPSG